MQRSLSRRDFLRPGRRAADVRIFPPGFDERALSSCTGCGRCAEICPTRVIRMEGALPIVDFTAGECTFCGACAQSCPEPVFTGGATDRFDHIVAIAGSCLPFHGVDCQACRDGCPSGAIRFRPVRGGPFVPEVMAEDCTGCGACIAVCPAGAVATAPKTMEAA